MLLRVNGKLILYQNYSLAMFSIDFSLNDTDDTSDQVYTQMFV